MEKIIDFPRPTPDSRKDFMRLLVKFEGIHETIVVNFESLKKYFPLQVSNWYSNEAETDSEPERLWGDEDDDDGDDE